MKYIYALFCLLQFVPVSAQHIRYQNTIKGGFTLTGNTFLNNALTSFLNTAPEPGITRSSYADLVLPAGSTVRKAILYVEGYTVPSQPLTSVKFRVPGGSYVTYTTASPGFLGNPGIAFGNKQFIVDVTADIPANGYTSTLIPGGDPSGAGRYAVADFDPVSANFGYGWSLFVVYTNPSSKLRNVTLADTNVSYPGPVPVSVATSGIIVPATGPVNAVVAATGTWGDLGLEDYVTFGIVGGNSVSLADPFTGDTTDVMNSSIAFAANNNVSADGGPVITGNFTGRNPYSFNIAGQSDWSSYLYDADIMNASGILPNSTTPVDVHMELQSTGGDALGGGAYAISVDVVAASLSKSVAPAEIYSGATATYTFTLANNAPGAINLSNLGFTDNLPSGLIVASPSAAAITGASGSVTATPGGNSIAVSGVSLNAGQVATVTVNVTNVPGQFNPSCNANPIAFTNGPDNISNLSSTLANTVSNQCLVVKPVIPPPPVTDSTKAGTDSIAYCLNAVAAPLSAIGSNLLWYTAATGGTGSPVAPTPSTAIAGTTTWYVSQTVNGVESGRAPLVVVVRPLTKPGFAHPAPICKGAMAPVLPATSINGISGVWSPSVVSNTTSGFYSFSPDPDTTGRCPDTASLFIEVYSVHAEFTTDQDTICQNGTIQFTNTSTTKFPPIYPQWNMGDSNVVTVTNPQQQYAMPGMYKVSLIVRDSLLCTDTYYRYITVDSASTLDLLMDKDTLCIGEGVDARAVYTKMGNEHISWDFGDGNTLADVDVLRYAYDRAGIFSVKVSADYRACADTSRSKTLVVQPNPVVYLGADTSFCPGSAPLILEDKINAANPKAFRVWNTGDTTASIIVRHEGQYQLTVKIDQCSTTDIIKIEKDCYLDIPNSFTPNDDGINDYFFPRQLLSAGLASFQMAIYNRWGQKVFETENPDGRGWDGKFNGKGQPQGVYVYQITVVLKNGRKEQYTGNVTLL